MLVKREVQPVGAQAVHATGSEHRDSFSAPFQLFAVAVTLDVGRAVVTLRGELDLMSTGALIACFAGISPAINEVVLDLAELDFIECSGLRAIIAMTHAAAERGGSLSIRSARPQLQRLLDLVNFEQLVASHS
jgi:anti-sigma B factor antagonist